MQRRDNFMKNIISRKKELLLLFISAALVISMSATGVFAAAKKDTAPPTVSKTNPVDYATDVMVDGHIQIRFSESIKKGSNISKITLKESDLTAVAYSYEIKDKFLTIIPKKNLKYGTAYTVNIPKGAVQDAAGNKLAKAFSFSFVTEEDPANAKAREEGKAYKYLVELEVSMNEQLTDTMAGYYSLMLNKFMGFDAVFKSIKEITPSPTAKPSKATVTPAPSPAASQAPKASVTPAPTAKATPKPTQAPEKSTAKVTEPPKPSPTKAP